MPQLKSDIPGEFRTDKAGADQSREAKGESLGAFLLWSLSSDLRGLSGQGVEAGRRRETVRLEED